MFKRIKEYFDKRAEKIFKATLTEEQLEFDRLSNLYGFDNITIITMCSFVEPCKTLYSLSPSVKQDDDKALKLFVKNGGVILHIDDENLRKKVKHCQKHQIQYIITTDIEELKYNKDS